MIPTPIKVLCVDDNPGIALALELKLRLVGGFHWPGWLGDADGLVAAVKKNPPHIVLLDLDMPGESPFGVLETLHATCPDSRVIIFSGHVGGALIDRAVAGGAWGYVCKSDGSNAFVSAIHQVARGNFVLSPDATAEHGR